MRSFGLLLRRDLRMGLGGSGGRGGFLLPVVFFLSISMLYPFAVGPDAPLLARTGGGVIWMAALLAAILPVDRLVGPDLESGMFDQLALRGVSEELAGAARIVAHWLSFGPPLMMAAVISAGLLGLDARQFRIVEIGLLVGTPGLAALGVMISAFTATLRGGSALSGLIALPMSVPLLIFGAGALLPGGENGLLLLAAFSLALCAVAPFAFGAALRASRE